MSVIFIRVSPTAFGLNYCETHLDDLILERPALVKILEVPNDQLAESLGEPDCESSAVPCN